MLAFAESAVEQALVLYATCDFPCEEVEAQKLRAWAAIEARRGNVLQARDALRQARDYIRATFDETEPTTEAELEWLDRIESTLSPP
jgi:hypothetical protein